MDRYRKWAGKNGNGVFSSFFTSDGLAFDNCWAIAEDYLGQMWFGSYGGGVTLFDGKQFQVFDQSDGLINNHIRHLYPYKDKVLVGTENGISIIDVKDREIESLPQTKRDPDLNYTSGFFENNNSLYYTTYRQGVYKIIFESGETEVIKVNNHLPIYAMGHFGDKIYSSNKGHVDLFDVDNFSTENPKPKSFGQSIIWSYVKYPPESIFGAAWGIYKEDGGVFLLSKNNMLSFDIHSGIGLKNFISATYDDENKTLYAGTTDKGLFAIHLDDKIFSYQDQKEAALGFVGQSTLEAILYADGIKFVDKSIFVDKKDFKAAQERFLTKLRNPLPKHEDNFFEMDYHTNTEDIIFYELHTQAGNIWVNTNIGIFELDSNGQFLFYLPEHSYVMGFSPTGKLMVSHPYAGLRVYEDVKNFKYTYYHSNLPEVPRQLSKMVYSKEKTFFASVFHGVFDYTEKAGFRSYVEEGMCKEKKFKTMHMDSVGNLYLGAEFGDLYVAGLKPNFNIKKHIPTSRIIGNSIRFIETFDDAILIGTESGLNIFHDETIRFIDHEQGLGNGLIHSGKVIKDKLYIGYDKGYYELNLPKILEERDYTHQLEIRQILVNNQAFQPDKMLWFTYNLDKISLKNHQNSLDIAFKPTGHPYPQKLLYRYRLGKEENWSAYTKESSISLASLSFGNYQLEVETFDLHSGKSTITSLFGITISPPLYLKWWFLLLVFLILLGLAGLIFKLRLRQVREQAEVSQKIVETKLEALRSHMNPHFIFNAVNSIQYYILDNQGEEALSFLGKFSKLMRNTLENSINPHIHLHKEVEYLRNYIELENKRTNNRVNWKIDVAQEIDDSLLKIPPMLIQPFVENVFVHAFSPTHEKPILAITFSPPEENMITCAIWDNGRGIQSTEKEKYYTSRGIDLVRERLSLLPGYSPDSIQVNSGPEQGTEIIIRIPCFFK